MAGIFTDGVEEIRPGTYFNVDPEVDFSLASAQNGIVGVVFRGTFGPLNEVVKISLEEGYYPSFGDGGNVDALQYAFLGGAQTILAVRVGEGGKQASVQLGEIATVTAKYPGSRGFSACVKDSLMDDQKKEIIFYAGNRQIESYSISKSEDKEGAALKEAMKQSKLFAVKVDTDGTLPTMSQKEFTKGEDPTVTVENYAAAFEKLNGRYVNAVCVDTEDPAVHLLLKAYLDRSYNGGFFGVAVIAELSSKALGERIQTALTFNDEKAIYLLNAHISSAGQELDGYQTAAIVAGLYASCPSNQALTHTAIPGAVELLEVLTSTEMQDAETKGCLVLSQSPDDTVWIDNAINTLVTLPTNKDAGWKKIRRTKTRFELMYRMNTTADRMVGKVDNDKNGRETVIAKLNEVGYLMVREGKLVSCKVTEHPYKKANADYAYFLIDVVDKDSLEHIYLYYAFAFNTSEEE